MDGERDTAAAPEPALAPAPIADSGADGAIEAAGDSRSLVNDIEDLLVNARNWLDAEFTYQKTRAGFVAASLKSGLALVAVAGLLAVLGLIGLTVGLIIALAPLLTAFGATTLVVGLLFALAALLVHIAVRRFRDAAGAFKEDEDQG